MSFETYILNLLITEGKTEALDELFCLREDGFISDDMHDHIYNLIRWY